MIDVDIPIEEGEDWSCDERSFIFEERLATGLIHKDAGNAHFHKEEWGQALRRYERAMYHANLDQMQQFDLLDRHKELLSEAINPVKLNYVACVLKVREADADTVPAMLDGEGEEENYAPLDRCEAVRVPCVESNSQPVIGLRFSWVCWPR